MSMDNPKCEVCGEPMPEGEDMFKFHGYSGPCPKPPMTKSENDAEAGKAGQAADDSLIEALANLCHWQWSGWMTHLFSKCETIDNGDRGDIAVIPEWAVQRWKRQMGTPYDSLSEKEKESDRHEARRIIEIVRAHDAKPEGKVRIGDFTISEDFTEGAIWINRQDGEGGSFSLKDFEAHIDEFYQKYF